MNTICVNIQIFSPLQRLLQWRNGEKMGGKKRERGKLKNRGSAGDDGKGCSRFPSPQLPRALFRLSPFPSLPERHERRETQI